MSTSAGTPDTTTAPESTIVKKPTDSTAPGVPSGKRPGMSDDAEVVFRFRDSSVPPPYHRSYVLTITKATTSIVVKDYSDVLAERSIATTAEAWDAITLGYAPMTELTPETPARGCTGGTGVGLRVTSAGQVILSLDAEVCGGVNSEISDRIREWLLPARSLLPATSVLAP